MLVIQKRLIHTRDLNHAAASIHQNNVRVCVSVGG